MKPLKKISNNIQHSLAHQVANKALMSLENKIWRKVKFEHFTIKVKFTIHVYRELYKRIEFQ